MSDHQSDSPRTDRQLRAVVEELRLLRPDTSEEATFHTESVKRVYDLADSRRLRLDASSSQLPGILWTVLVVGGVITIGFTYFFGVSNFASHVLMVTALAAMTGLTLFLVLSLDMPFSGDLRVGPDAMKRTIREFSHLGAS